MTRPGVPVIDRILDKCFESAPGCWEFCGATQQGYGVINLGGGKLERTHRVTYEYFRAEIPAGLHIDHLCANRLCCNPWHLEPVTPRENTRRAYGTGACRKGHALTPENSYYRPDGVGGPRCRVCINHGWRKKSLGLGLPGDRPACPQGHEYVGDNLFVYVRPDGSKERRCRECARQRAARRRARKKAST